MLKRFTFIALIPVLFQILLYIVLLKLLKIHGIRSPQNNVSNFFLNHVLIGFLVVHNLGGNQFVGFKINIRRRSSGIVRVLTLWCKGIRQLYGIGLGLCPTI